MGGHWQEQRLPPEQRGVYHLLLLGQGGSGKTHIVQNILFPVMLFIWPPEGGQETLKVVAAKNSQAKNSSTDAVRASTLHAAACMRVQNLSNGSMAAGTQEKRLQKHWQACRCLIIEEISMVSALLYNMLNFRSMLGRRHSHSVEPHTYTRVGHAFGRLPVVLHLGDFFQLRPTVQISLLDDLLRTDSDGSLLHPNVMPEIQHAQKVFGEAPDVFELRGTMRFVTGDPLIELWRQLKARFAQDAGVGQADPRLNEENFRSGYCMSIYWTFLSRMLSRRAILDARQAEVLLVLLQCADECSELEKEAAFRFLSQPNPNRTGHAHGILPCHVGMEIRLLAKLDGQAGMVQDTQAVILDFEFHAEDRAAHKRLAPGSLFSPRFLPSGLWVSVKGYAGNQDWPDVFELCRSHVSTGQELMVPAGCGSGSVFSSTQKYTVRRCGFQITHAKFLTSTASQGITLRQGTIVDCARLPEMDDDNWWLHLYVMFSRVTKLDDLLLFRPPPRDVLERGPPSSIQKSLEVFLHRAERCRAGAQQLKAAAERHAA